MSATPGPWLVRVEGTLTGRGPEVYVEGAHYADGSEFVIADCGCAETRAIGRGQWKRTADADAIEANARLIAAAPDLLAALLALMTEVESFQRDEHFDVAVAELAVARTALAKARGQ